MSKIIYLARHAQSESNTGEKISVNEQIAITQTGHAQSHKLADWFLAHITNIEAVFVSNYLRTQQTAKPLIEKLQSLGKLNRNPEILSELHEFNCLNFANIKGQDFAIVKQIAEHYWQTATPDFVDGADLNVPKNWQAESFDEFVNRVKSAMAYFDALPQGAYVVFTHGIWLSMLHWLILNKTTDSNQAMRDFRQFELANRPNNCDVFCLKIDDGQYEFSKIRHSDGDNSAMM